MASRLNRPHTDQSPVLDAMAYRIMGCMAGMAGMAGVLGREGDTLEQYTSVRCGAAGGGQADSAWVGMRCAWVKVIGIVVYGGRGAWLRS